MNFIYFFIALALSMDAFSLALAYGTTTDDMKKVAATSLIVGFFHFIMPYLGFLIGAKINFLFLKANVFVGLVFLFLALEMLFSKAEENKGFIKNIFSMLLFALTVSLDSFSVGIALGTISIPLPLIFLTFSIVSFLCTFAGFLIGNYLSQKYGAIASYFGVLILFGLALKYFLNI